MKKLPFVTKEKAQEIIRTVPTPFHLYDEEGIRKNARDVLSAFSWNKGFREYYAVKACANPEILRILKEEGVEVVYLPRTPEISTTQIKQDLNRG